MAMSKTYITSPIYYVNDVPHIGHAYTTFLCDMLKKHFALRNHDVKFLTGTDEHGQKIEQSAFKNNQSPQAYVDSISSEFRALWDSFGIEYDVFVRTTDSKHCLSVQKAFEIMFAKGDIYKGKYEGQYCISCESFFAQSQLKEDGGCPDCGKPTSLVQEESYFFALSKYQNQLLEYYEKHPDLISPSFRKNEVVRFVQEGLNDLSITRTGFEWGIPLESHPQRADSKQHIMYVWLDALLSYVSGIGYLQENFERGHWENAIHFVGKDILRFHAVYWLAFLMSLDLPLPKRIYTHGWWLRDGAKMSKSIGNVINPKEFAQAYGVEALRYFLLREMPFGQDGDFSQKIFVERINAELSNDVGNLLNRLLGMAQKYFDWRIDCTQTESFFASELQELAEILRHAEQKMTEMQPNRYIEELWRAFALGNGVIAKYEPWNLIKNNETDKAMALLGLVATILARACLYLYPILPQSASKIAQTLCFELSAESFQELVVHQNPLKSFTLSPLPPLFPKIESLLIPEGDSVVLESAKPALKDSQDSQKLGAQCDGVMYIDIADFSKVEIRVAQVIECTPVPKSQKLLKLMVDVGEGRLRQILSGIAQFYSPEDLLQKQVCVITNLKPAKLMGQMSEGMILASKDENGLSLLTLDRPRVNGSRIS